MFNISYNVVLYVGPVLCCAIAPDQQTVFSGGIDTLVKMWNPVTNAPPVDIGKHDEPIREMKFCRV